MKLNDNEKVILAALAEDYDNSGWEETGFYAFNSLVRKTGIERRKVRLACRSLARKGLAKFASGLVDEDGMMAGSGYGATKQGAALINPCDNCAELADYDWWDKDGEQTFPNAEGATRIRKCEKHYQELKGK